MKYNIINKNNKIDYNNCKNNLNKICHKKKNKDKNMMNIKMNN